MKHHKLTLKTLSLLTFSLLSFNLIAETPEEKGLAIAIESEKRDRGWTDSKATMSMTLQDRKGRITTQRKIRSFNLEVNGDGDKGLTIFDTPKDVKGTAFLSFSHALKPDDQWLYLPALKRTKRISSSNKAGPFMGSEFAYEDLSSFEIEKYNYKFIKDDTYEGQAVFVVESTPNYKHSGYSRLINFIDKAEYRVLKTDYYDRNNKLLKTLHNKNYKQFLDKYWRPLLMEVTNHQTQKKTSLEWSDFEFKTGLGDSDFTKNKLKRLR